nr:hypothetical protein [Mycolicibacterium sp. CH28]
MLEERYDVGSKRQTVNGDIRVASLPPRYPVVERYVQRRRPDVEDHQRTVAKPSFAEGILQHQLGGGRLIDYHGETTGFSGRLLIELADDHDPTPSRTGQIRSSGVCRPIAQVVRVAIDIAGADADHFGVARLLGQHCVDSSVADASFHVNLLAGGCDGGPRLPQRDPGILGFQPDCLRPGLNHVDKPKRQIAADGRSDCPPSSADCRLRTVDTDDNGRARLGFGHVSLRVQVVHIRPPDYWPGPIDGWVEGPPAQGRWPMLELDRPDDPVEAQDF